MNYSVLCVEDDPDIQKLISHSLKECTTTICGTLLEAQEILHKENFDAIIFDIELPDGDGIHFYSTLVQNKKFQEIPVLFLSANTNISSKVLALTLGADDFINKPFNPLELNIRVISKIKKNAQKKEENKIKIIHNIQIDLDKQKVFQLDAQKKIDLDLTTLEFRIFVFLSTRIEHVYSREKIIEEIWHDTHISNRTVDSHIAHLRKKLKSTDLILESVKNSGYRLSIINTNQ